MLLIHHNTSSHVQWHHNAKHHSTRFATGLYGSFHPVSSSLAGWETDLHGRRGRADEGRGHNMIHVLTSLFDLHSRISSHCKVLFQLLAHVLQTFVQLASASNHSNNNRWETYVGSGGWTFPHNRLAILVNYEFRKVPLDFTKKRK